MDRDHDLTRLFTAQDLIDAHFGIERHIESPRDAAAFSDDERLALVKLAEALWGMGLHLAPFLKKDYYERHDATRHPHD